MAKPQSKTTGVALLAVGNETLKRTKPPISAKHPEGQETLVREVAELHLFDPETGEYFMQSRVVEAVILELGNWNYWLKVTGDNESSFGHSIENNLNPSFDFEYLTAIFNVREPGHLEHSLGHEVPE